MGTSTPTEGGFGSGSRVLSIQGSAADDFGVLELISPDVTSSNRIGEIRFGNLDGGSSSEDAPGFSLVVASAAIAMAVFVNSRREEE